MRFIFLIVILSLLIFPISAKGEEDGVFLPLDGIGLTLPEKIRMLEKESGKVLEIGFEEYIVGVTAAEMPCSFPEEALKAQAVAARTYALYQMEKGHKGGCDICDSPA